MTIRPKPVVTAAIQKQPQRSPAPPPPWLAPSTQTEPPPPIAPRTSARPTIEPARPEVYNFRFAADKRFKDKFERLAEVMGVEHAQQHMAELFEKALDVALEKKDPKKKLERREKRAQAKSRLNEIPKTEHRSPSRYIPSQVSERVHARGAYQCEYRAPDGARCPSRTGLQIEHVRPFGIYRSHDERFLKLLCPAHNRLATERVYGASFIERKIAERRASARRE